MWHCECGCVDRIERKYKAPSREEGGKGEMVEKTDVTWRPRQAVPVQSLARAQTYLLLVVCTGCHKLWDDYLLASPLWKEALELQRAVSRMETEAHGKQLPADWEAKRAALFGLDLKIRGLAVSWMNARKDEVSEANKAAKVDEVNAWM